MQSGVCVDIGGMAGPSMRHEFLQGMQQRLVLQPRMLQSVEILQLAAQDLWGYLADKALVNEAISLDSVQRPESDFEAPRMAAGGREASDAHLRVLHSHWPALERAGSVAGPGSRRRFARG
ncbi:MAG: hypothetical protein R3E96_04415 [Planctomycetota bacterium]